MSVRALLGRVQRLECARRTSSPIVAAFGSFAEFESRCAAEIADGRLDPRDFPVVVMCLQRWEGDGTWSAWTRHRIWERGGVA